MILKDIGHKLDLPLDLALLLFGGLRIFQHPFKPLDFQFPFPDLPEQLYDFGLLLFGEFEVGPGRFVQ